MIGEKQDPLHTNFKELEHVKRISISSKGSVTHTYL
jgi:hypothetical protein